MRIGNWVKVRQEYPTIEINETVDNIDENGINHQYYDGEHDFIYFSQVSGIPLEESILVKCGFEKVPNFTVLNSYTLSVGRNRHLSIGCVGTPNEVMFLVDSDSGGNQSDCIVIHNFDYNGKLYLHTLQNWFYLATGEELTITL